MDSFTQTHIYLFNYFLLFTFLFSFFTFSYAQVKIKEKVEIKPQTKVIKGYNQITTTHTIKAVVEWDTMGGTHNFLRAKMKLLNGCSSVELESNFVYDGYIELELSTDQAARFDIDVYTESNNYPIDNSWFPSEFATNLKIYADGNLVDETTYGYTSVLPWRSDLTLNIGTWFTNTYENALCPNEEVPFYVDDNECNPAIWAALENSINVSIIEGAEYTSFYSYYTDEFIGDNIAVTTDIHGNYNTAWGEVHLRYDEDYSSSTDPKEIILEAEVSGIYARDTIVIFPTSNNYLVEGEIEDYIERIIRWEKLTINSWLETDGYCGGAAEPPENTTFSAEIIQGSQFGGLVNPNNGGASNQLTGLTAVNGQVKIQYFANGELTENEEEVIVRISSSLPNSTPKLISFYVQPSELYLEAIPEEISVSELADLNAYWYNEVGSLELVPSDYPLQVEIIDGAEYGDIYDPITNVYADSFDEVYQGFKFKSDENIEADSVSVLVRVSAFLFGGGGVLASEKKEDYDLNETESKNNFKNKEKTSLHTSKKIKSSTKIKKSKTVSSTFFGYEVYGIARVVIKKDEPKLKILKPSLLVEPYIYYINATPTMPNITLLAERSGILNLPGETAAWTCTLSYSYPIVYSTRMPNGDTLTSTQTYTGETTFDGSDVTEWNLNFNNSEPIIGGEARITVTATVDGEQYADTIVVYIRGENPDDADVEAETDDNGQLTMIETEVPGYSQFDTETYAVPNDGLPLRSDADDHGWGLGQIDDRYHIITTELLWDWTANLEWSLSYYNGHRDRAERRLENDGNLDNPIAGHTRQSMIDYEGYARYNSNWYAHVWEWIPPTEQNPGRWVRNVTILLDGERVYSGEVDRHLQNYESNY